MSYIGNPVTTAAFLTDTFSGDGSTTSFTMQVAPATTASMLVSISGVLQAPASYNISGTTLTFTGAPPSGSSNISVRYLGVPASVVAGVAGGSSTQVQYNSSGVLAGSANMTFDGSTLTANALKSATLGSPAATALTVQSAGTTAITIDTSQNVGIGTSSPAGKLDISGAAAPSLFINDTRTPTQVQLQSQNGFGWLATTTNHSFGFATNNTERMRITSAGAVGIGTTPSSSWNTSGYYPLQIGGTGVMWGRGGEAFVVGSNTYVNSSGDNVYLTTGASTFYNQTTGTHQWYTAPSGTAGATATFTERMRIDSSGNLLVGASSTARSNCKVYIKGPDDNQLTLDCPSGATYTSLYFYNNGTFKVGQNFDTSLSRFSMQCISGGGVYLASGGTSWTSGSDERIKENLVPISDALNKVSSLRSFTGNYIKDETKTSKAFLIAQDVLKVLPEAVDTTNPDEYGLSYTDIIPLLVASIKELNAKVDAQAAEIKALTAKVGN